MWSITITAMEDALRVRALRWRNDSPYPAQLLDFDLVPGTAESELAVLERVGTAVANVARERRSRLY